MIYQTLNFLGTCITDVIETEDQKDLINTVIWKMKGIDDIPIVASRVTDYGRIVNFPIGKAGAQPPGERFIFLYSRAERNGVAENEDSLSFMR